MYNHEERLQLVPRLFEALSCTSQIQLRWRWDRFRVCMPITYKVLPLAEFDPDIKFLKPFVRFETKPPSNVQWLGGRRIDNIGVSSLEQRKKLSPGLFVILFELSVLCHRLKSSLRKNNCRPTSIKSIFQSHRNPLQTGQSLSGENGTVSIFAP